MLLKNTKIVRYKKNKKCHLKITVTEKFPSRFTIDTDRAIKITSDFYG